MSSTIESFNVCVFCGSQEGKNKEFLNIAYQLGRELSSKGHKVIYGGGKKGLMGNLSKGVLENNGNLISVIPKYFKVKKKVKKEFFNTIITKGFSDRKDIMIKKADIFICLPGGLGTLDELFEVMTLNQLRIIDKKIILVDINKYWDPLKTLLKQLDKNGFLYNIKNSNILFKNSVNKIMEFLGSNMYEK